MAFEHYYVDQDGKEHEYIYCLREGYQSSTELYLPGYYFLDETHDLNGPFPTLKDVKESFAAYCKYVLGLEE